MTDTAGNTNQLLLENERLQRRVEELEAEAKRFTITEEKFKVSEARLIEAQKVAHLGSWEWDVALDVITASQEFYRLFDVEPEQIARFQQFVECLHPADRERVGTEVNEALRQNRIYDTDYRVRQRDGGWRGIHARGQLFTDANGKPVRLAGTCIDITERKRAEEALRASEQRLRRFYESGLLGVIYWNMRGQITEANDKFLEMVGYTRAELDAGQIDWLNMTPPEYRQLDEASVAELRTTGVNRRPLEKEYIRKDGTRIPIAVAGAMLDEERVNGVAFVLDIAERVRAEAAVRESEERNRTTLQSLGDAVISTDGSGRVVQMNPVAETLTGWREAEVRGQPLEKAFRIVNEETRAVVENPVARVLREGQVVGLANHTILIAKNGEGRPIADSGAPIRDAKGDTTGVVLVFRDQTEERRAEKEVRAAEERFRGFFDNAPIGKSVTSPDGKILRVNPAFGAMLGYSIEEMQTISFPAITHPDDLTESREGMRALLAGERDVWAMEKRYLAKDGSLVWTHVTTRLQRDDEGKPLHFITHVEDITERKLAHQEIESLARFPGENPNPVLRVRRDGTIIYANASSADLLVEWGCAVDDSLPSDLRRLITTSYAEKANATVDVACNRRVFSFLFVPVPGTDYINLYGQDVTDRRKAGDEIRQLNASLEQRVRERTAELEESNRELEAFSYSVSHDLRAPLRAIDGFTRILADEYAQRLDTEAMRLCSVVRENAKGMGQLIDDLLAFSRLGRAEMKLSPIDMGAMASAVFQELTTPESRPRIDFQVGLLPTALADPTLMRQVWMNLLSNAIKFSSKQERAVIRVSAQQGQGETVYAVEDDGAGFEMQYVDKLFGVFQRLHSARDFEGTGVGLALVQRVIRRHGGRIWATGEPDKGATFCFALQQRGA